MSTRAREAPRPPPTGSARPSGEEAGGFATGQNLSILGGGLDGAEAGKRPRRPGESAVVPREDGVPRGIAPVVLAAGYRLPYQPAGLPDNQCFGRGGE